MPLPAMLGALVAAAATTFALMWMYGRRRKAERLAMVSAEAAVLVRGAKLEGAASRRAAETAARERGLELRRACDAELASAREKLVSRERKIAGREVVLSEAARDLDQRSEAVDERFDRVKSLRDRARGLYKDVEDREQELLERLEERCGTSGGDVAAVLSQQWIEQTRAEAAHNIRVIEQSSGDAAYEEVAKRLMHIAVGRYRNHFLTERNISKLPIDGKTNELLEAEDGRVHHILEEVSNVKLNKSEEGDYLRLEGLDGVGREVARRAVNRFIKKPGAIEEVTADPTGWVTKIRTNLDREIYTLGKKAFKVLKVPRADDEIIQLVGALNYRTSYTQNQWLHAVEASFLCGVIADELGLDVKLARRATLMHDIGKALTHKIEGSHAVIGADIARRLGEDEVTANAIGAHHLDEPMNSPYAFLVAAADAMSGGRPGARREFTDDYSSRLYDLERIGKGHRGVDRAFAVHGGRELRVYVREKDVSDLQAVELSSAIAGQVAEEMTFPGQIKVTVIRAYEAISVAN